MACIDNMYGTKEQYYSLVGFLTINKKQFIEDVGYEPYFNDYSDYTLDWSEEHRIYSYDFDQDLWLINNCDFDWLIKDLLESYGVNTIEECRIQIKKDKDEK